MDKKIDLDIRVRFRKARGYCRGCGCAPKNKAIIFVGKWNDGNQIYCQDCAIAIKERLSDLNLSGTIADRTTEIKDEDLSTI